MAEEKITNLHVYTAIGIGTAAGIVSAILIWHFGRCLCTVLYKAEEIYVKKILERKIGITGELMCKIGPVHVPVGNVEISLKTPHMIKPVITTSDHTGRFKSPEEIIIRPMLTDLTVGLSWISPVTGLPDTTTFTKTIPYIHDPLVKFTSIGMLEWCPLHFTPPPPPPIPEIGIL